MGSTYWSSFATTPPAEWLTHKPLTHVALTILAGFYHYAGSVSGHFPSIYAKKADNCILSEGHGLQIPRLPSAPILAVTPLQDGG